MIKDDKRMKKNDIKFFSQKFFSGSISGLTDILIQKIVKFEEKIAKINMGK